MAPSDEDVVEYIEKEIECGAQGSVPVVEFYMRPHPQATPSELTAYHDYFDGGDESVSRYFRLRLFETFGVFDDETLHCDYDTSDPFEPLAEEERDKLEAI